MGQALSAVRALWWWLLLLRYRLALTAEPNPHPGISADRAEDLPTAAPAPTSHCAKVSGGEVEGREKTLRDGPSPEFSLEI
jgi:hypothetical protein